MAVTVAALAPGHASATPDGVTTKESPWLLEEDFDADPTLHARVDQTVLLRLEQGARRGRDADGPPGRNIHRLLVEQAGAYQFCLPADEPHLTRLKLREGRPDQVDRGKGQARGRTILQLRPGDNCEDVRLDPGSYVFETDHDHRSVPPGKVAFIRSPDRTRIEGDPLTSSTARFSFMTWKGPNGLFVTGTDGNANLTATAATVDEHTVWKFDGVPPGDFRMSDGAGNPVQGQSNDSSIICPPQLFVGPPRTDPNQPVCASQEVEFYMEDASAREFRLIGKNTAFSEDGLYGYDSGYVLGGGNVVANEGDPTRVGITWFIDFRGFECTSGACDASQMSLAPGEVALFAQENYQGAAIVYTTDVADFSIYDAAAAEGLAIGDKQVASIRVGPGTSALVYPDAQYGGGRSIVSEDVPSLAAGPNGATTVSSMQVVNTRQFLIGTNGCAGCNLTGIDLSGVDLASADLSGANLTSANLTGTDLFGADLDDAIFAMATLDSTDFVDTSLRCTDFSDTDLRTAEFMIADDAIAAVTDQVLAALVAVEPGLGGRAFLAGQGTGSGVALETPYGVTRSPQGVLLTDKNRVLRIVDGNVTVVSSSDRGTGLDFFLAAGITLDGEGSIIVPDFFRQILFRVDPATGDRTRISSSNVGSGPAFSGPADAAVADDGTIYVTNGDGMSIFAVDPSTGDRSVVSDAATGSGPPFMGPGGILIDSHGSLLVTDSQIPALVSVDPVSGDRTIVSGAGAGSGPALVTPGGLVSAADGTLLVVDASLPGVLRIDPATGERTIVSGAGVGGGPPFSFPLDIALTDAVSLSGRIVTDFSCRVDLARTQLRLETFPPGLWRYFDLRFASIADVSGAQLSTQEAPLDLSGAILNGVDLSGSILDAADFSCVATSNSARTSCNSGSVAGSVCTCLQGTNLGSAMLRKADMEQAQMQGVSLTLANLDGADLSGANLQGLTDPDTGVLISSTDISGAFMRNVDLTAAKLGSVTANNLNFFSATSFSGRSTADATDADFTNASLTGAYLAGAVFNGLVAQGTSWEGAVLAGADFSNADLEANQTVQFPSNFSRALMHGPIFANPSIDSVTFNGTYWDTTPPDNDMALVVELTDANLKFAGYWNDPNQPLCVDASYGPENIPVTSSSNRCPDDSFGPCQFTEAPSGGPPLPFVTCTSDDLGSFDPSCFDLVPKSQSQSQCMTTDLYWTDPDLTPP